MIQQITQSIKPAFYQSGTQSITYTRKDSCLSDVMLIFFFLLPVNGNGVMSTNSGVILDDKVVSHAIDYLVEW